MTGIIPLPHLSDGSLIVRLATADDIPAILAFFIANREAMCPVEPRRPDSFYTSSFWEMRVALNLSHYERAHSVCLFVFEPDDQTVIGDINFTNISGYPHHGCTLGYALAESQWGRGRMQRALNLAIPWIFDMLNLHRVAANHLPDNERSARLLQKLGFQREGMARDYLLIDGLWRDHILTALTHSDWQARDHTAPLVHKQRGKD
ncbi:GNAT family N-acetyltransferase [Chitinimonas sp. PSY-7]|uniref:GNAT family N-acetyltransferase n=1 Tax=Chitinimonas sp. PSY-7 TaxID=3459088 RepID=UPI00404011F7